MGEKLFVDFEGAEKGRNTRHIILFYKKEVDKRGPSMLL